MQAETFGHTKRGDEVLCYTLTNSGGGQVKILSYGGTIQSITVPDKDGKLQDVVLGYDTVAEYEQNDGYLGAMIGRFGNRIRGGVYTLSGVTYHLALNNGANHLHGGDEGFDKKIWTAEEYGNQRLVLSYLSPDGEEGYPGNLQVTISYDWSDDYALTLSYVAKTDKDTVINLTNHSYFNLNGQSSGSALNHMVRLHADKLTENDATCCPTGVIAEVAGTPFDFSDWHTVGERIFNENEQLTLAGGYDHNYVLSNDGKMVLAGEMYAPESGIYMTATTNQPGMQFYSGNFIPKVTGKQGAEYDIRYGLCFETQGFPNSTEYPHFPSPVCTPDTPYERKTVYKFSVSEKIPE